MSITRTSGLVLLLLLSCCWALRAQTDYNIEHFTTDNGLPSNGIKGLQWDDQTGFLWIATEAGITRYNGSDFVTFNRSNTPGFFSERMLFLLKTRDGRLYTSDEAGNLFLILKNKPQLTGQVKIDTRPTTFKLVGLVASGKMFRQSSLQPPPGFGFDFFTQTLLPVSEDRLLLTQKDSLYDYRLGRPAPAFVTTVPAGSRLFYLQDYLFCFNEQQGFSRLSTDSPVKIPLPSPLPSGLKGCQLFWDNSMKSPILVAGTRAWTLEYKQNQLV
ncbi:MAG TPA: hypothetical protein VI233_12840, partial [Puia sp.]